MPQWFPFALPRRRGGGLTGKCGSDEERGERRRIRATHPRSGQRRRELDAAVTKV
jgi:hypothetical protein